MQSLRKQTIWSSIFMILGFAFGGITILLLTKYNILTKDQIGLTKTIVDFSVFVTAFSCLGLTSVLYKFYPYYNDNLPKKKNELFTITFIGCLVGFLVLCFLGLFIKPYVVKKYAALSPLVVEYYPYLFVFGFGMALFTVFETLAFVRHLSVVSNFLKETLLRFITLTLLVLLALDIIPNFNTYLNLYSLQFFVLTIIIFIYLKNKGEANFYFGISRVTKKFYKKMFAMQSLIYSGFLIFASTQIIDALTLGAKQGQSVVGDFAIVQYGANLVSVPSKAMMGGSIGLLTQAWKNKNMQEIERLYSRSCINLSIMALFIFGNIWLNAIPVIDVFGINPTWKIGINAMFFFCLARTIEASTGINNMIIGTSTFWKFEFLTGVILLGLRFPTTYFLVDKFGLMGSAYADIFSVVIYNAIRFIFLRKKFKMNPYNYKNLFAILFAVASYFIAFYCFKNYTNFAGIILRSSIFSCLFIVLIFGFNLTPDAKQLFDRWILKIKK